MDVTNKQFDEVVLICREIFARSCMTTEPPGVFSGPESVTDQIFIKANRIRSLEVKKRTR